MISVRTRYGEYRGFFATYERTYVRNKGTYVRTVVRSYVRTVVRSYGRTAAAAAAAAARRPRRAPSVKLALRVRNLNLVRRFRRFGRIGRF